MISLNKSTKKLQAVLGGAVTTTELDFVTTYRDGDLQERFSWPSQDGVTTGATAVDIVDAPGVSSEDRIVNSITIHNVDTVNQTVTIQFVNSVTGSDVTRTIFKATLATLETLVYEDGAGWSVLTATGSTKATSDFASTAVSFGSGFQDRGTEAITATVGGGTTGLISEGTKSAIVTSAAATSQISLPTASIGDELWLIVSANGCELIAAVASHEANDVVVGATNELALAADSSFLCRYIAVDKWIVRGFTKLGADIAALVPDSL